MTRADRHGRVNVELVAAILSVTYRVVRDAAVWFLLLRAVNAPEWLYGAGGVLALLVVLAVINGVKSGTGKQRKSERAV
jgi:hypothetical protein